MPGPPIQLITVSRQYGSGGGELARRLGERLGWRVVGPELVREVAERLRVPEQAVAEVDEHVAGLAERVASYLGDMFPELMLPPFPPREVDHESVAVVVESVLHETAAAPPLIIVGHGGQCLFAEREDALHLRVYALTGHRARQLVERFGMAEDEAEDEIRRRDERRRRYLDHRYDRDWADPHLYHVLINSAAVGPDEAAAVIERLVRLREA